MANKLAKRYNIPLEGPEAARRLLSMPLEDKVYQTCVNITNWDIFTDGNWYVSFSGGKDSTVLLYLAALVLNRYANPPHPLRVLFCDTGLEYPEIRRFVPWYIDWLREKFPRLPIEYTRKRPELNFFHVIHDYGYPIISKEISQIIEGARRGQLSSLQQLDGTYGEYHEKGCFEKTKYQFLLKAPFLISGKCCTYTKKQPANLFARQNKLQFMSAVMACESRRRMTAWMKTGCNAYEGKHPQSKPMSFWKEQDVLRYILQEGIPVCSVYGEIKPFDGKDFYSDSLIDMPLKCTGCARTGCIFCGFGAHLEKGETRFQRLKRTHPKHWNYCINGGEWDPVDNMWKPSRTPGHIGMGMARVLDFIGVPYE